VITYDLAPLWDLDARVVFFPVRHHSPAAARLVRELLERVRPDAVLVEGPSDFNTHLDELFLPHRLPIAVYTYVRFADDQRRGGYYPFCQHSPEWQAVQTTHLLRAAMRFIDLPWADVARDESEPVNRYADAHLRRSAYIQKVCQRVGVEDINDLWDLLFEIDGRLPLETYLERCHSLCGHWRLIEGEARLGDRNREAFMAAQIAQACQEFSGRIVVVTGGYHSVALHARLHGKGASEAGDLVEPAACVPTAPAVGEERGIALTPYSFERLDSLAGYDAGMPNPGFYHQVWQDRQNGRLDTHHTLLARITERLRERGQTLSSADLIAAEATAQGLASMRGHAEVWRNDLLDGLVGAVIKDELATGGRHPLLEAIHEVLRGGQRGLLAEGTVLPPIVHDIQRQLEQHDLLPIGRTRDVSLDLEQPDQRPRSRILHRLHILMIPGYERTGGTDLAARDEMTRVWEQWRIGWSPEFDATCIESSRYGPTLADAAAARLSEDATRIERDADAAAVLFLHAALAGLADLAQSLRERLRELIRGEADFFSVTAALGHLLYLFRYDSVLDTAGGAEVGALLRECFARGLWLLETLGQVSDRDRDLIAAIQAIRETFERCGLELNLERDELLQVFTRVGSDRAQTPLVRGAAAGVLWSLGASDSDQVTAQMRRFADPYQLGDFLTGLFALAREQVQRKRELILSIHTLLARYTDDDFLVALPALRLAFTYFTPREKHHMALTLREGLGLAGEPEMAALAVDAGTAAAALAFEGRLFGALGQYGLRGGDDPHQSPG
jgi:hypothetical protein